MSLTWDEAIAERDRRALRSSGYQPTCVCCLKPTDMPRRDRFGMARCWDCDTKCKGQTPCPKRRKEAEMK
jgi:hypothetical protein